MTPFTIITTALTSLGANKLRAGLTLLGIVIGVAAFITLMAIGRGSQESITSRIESLGSNLLFITPPFSIDGSSALTLDDADALVDPVFTPTVVDVSPEISTFAQIVYGRVNTSAPVVGVAPSYESVRLASVASGQFIAQRHVENRSTVLVLGSQVAQDLFGLRDPVGQGVRLNGRRFTVIGVLESRGGTGIGQDYQALVPITTAYYRLSAQRTTQGGVTIQSITAQVVDEESMDAATRQIETLLRLRHRITGDSDFTIVNQQDILETVEETTETFVIFLGAIAGISLVVGGIGIMNIMLVSVTERTREIGIRKAVGAKRRDILFQFMSEATILSIGGGGVGVLLGLVLSRLIDGVTWGTQSFATVTTADIPILALIVSAGIGLFFGIYPAIRASRLHPIEALRYE